MTPDKQTRKATFLAKAKAKHGDKFDYSQVEYKHCFASIKITCPIHGLFQTTPAEHTNGKHGCPQCADTVGGQKQRKTQTQFIQQAKAKHGDKFNYSVTHYITFFDPIQVCCPLHGVFDTTPNRHLLQYGCPKCGVEARAKLNRKTTKSFIEEAKAIHGNKFDYSLVEYKNNTTPVQIICPIHGLFKSAPTHHLQPHGCQKCGRVSTGNFHRKTTDAFIKQAKAVHGDKYNYAFVAYQHNLTPVQIGCPVHGTFSITPSQHTKGAGCPQCRKDQQKKAQTGFGPRMLNRVAARTPRQPKFVVKQKAPKVRQKTQINPQVKFLQQANAKHAFIQEAVTIHGLKYDYSRVIYLGNRRKIEITCPVHGSFTQSPKDHLNKTGCPTCLLEQTKEKQRELKQIEFVRQATKVHKGKYDYTHTHYLGNKTPIKILCPVHGVFNQRASHHLSGQWVQEVWRPEIERGKTNALGRVYQISKKSSRNQVRLFKRRLPRHVP